MIVYGSTGYIIASKKKDYWDELTYIIGNLKERIALMADFYNRVGEKKWYVFCHGNA